MWLKSNFAQVKTEYTYSQLYMLKSNSNMPEPHEPQHDCPIACVIAQQHSSATLISHWKFWHMFQQYHYSNFYFKKNACQSLQNLKIRKLKSVCKLK